MATGVQFRDFCVAKNGYRYEVGPTRTTGVDGYFDCSGLMVYGAKSCGLDIPTVSSTQARWAHAAGLDRMPVAAALAEPGCLLFRGANFGYDGIGPDGHVCATMGDGGNVIEARGHDYGVLIDSGLARDWSNAARMPGLDYGSGPAPTPTVIEGNSMYQPDEICDVYTDGHGNTWGLLPTGAIYSLTGENNFYGGYPNLRDGAGHPFPARTDFGHITGRWDQRTGVDRKPGYTIWSVNYRKGEHYDFGPDHPGHITIP